MEKLTPKLYNWASILEDKTRAQAELTATMPFIWPHMALMPDAHLGKGATVGSVIPTAGAIMPAAVGVDIGCLDAQTEYLSPGGWKRISEYDGGLVMQYDPADDSAQFTMPSQFIDLPCDEFFHFKNSKGMDQMLSAEHKILVFAGFKSRGYTQQVMSPAELADRSLSRGYYCTKAAFTSSMPDLDISDELIRIEVMIQADGHLRNSTDTHQRVEVHIRKPRKVERARFLLRTAHLDFSENLAKDGTTYIAFSVPLEYGSKTLNRYWQASARQLRVLTEQVMLWDGHHGYRPNFSNTDKNSVDLVQYAFSATGIRAGISSTGKQEAHHAEGFLVTPTRNIMVGYCTPKTVPSPDGRKYCFTVETGFFVARRNGKIFTTGNCGMIAHRTSLHAEQLEDPALRKRVRESVESRVPVSAGGYNHKLYSRRTERRVDELSRMPGAGEAGALANWDMQLGTLGSGNHFIEVSLDEDDRVWLFLHSGSRGVGNKLAMKYIKAAQEYCDRNRITLPHPDLAYLVEGTQEFSDYLRDLRWAQHFALLNREDMMDRVVDAVSELGNVTSRWYVDERVNCHHNYTEVMPGELAAAFAKTDKMRGDREVYLSRKGAIDASAGVPGLIPGSMGAASYVVEGNGNPMSLWSSPHGAGREYSRGEARRTFTRADLDARMAERGTEWRHTDAFLDEHPSAYKNIDTVMADAASLVSVKHTLRAIINVKGD